MDFKYKGISEDKINEIQVKYMPKFEIPVFDIDVMKKYAMPLLSKIDRESSYFPTAERLIRMLKFFDDLDDKWVPCNSVFREFIGGSCYADV